VLERVMLRPDQHVQAEHALEERRAGEGNALDRIRGKRDADQRLILSSEEQLTRS
jgi:hypothetical protein